MTGYMIKRSLFFMLYDYFVYENEINHDEIKEALLEKMQSLQRSRLYTMSKTASTEAEREAAFQEYLELTEKVRINELNNLSV